MLRSPVIFRLILAVACLGMSPCVQAQSRGRPPSSAGERAAYGDRSGRSVDIDYAMLPSFTPADLPLIIEVIKLDDGQSLVVETLLDDYVSSFSDASQAVRVELQDARPGSISGETLEGMQRGRSAMDRQVEVMRKALSDRIRDAETSQERARIREEFTREMSEFMKQQDAVTEITGDSSQWSDFLQKQSEILRTWNERRREIDDEFVGAIQIVLEPDQVESWKQARASIRRRIELSRGRLEGERMDMIGRFNELVPAGELRTRILPTLNAYEMELDGALSARHAFMLEAGPVLSEVLRSGDWSRMQAVIQEEAVVRTRVRDLHVATFDVLTNVLPEPLRLQLLAEVHREFNSSIWSKGRFERAVDAAMAREDVTDSERARLESLLATCMTGIDEIRAQQDSLARELAPQRWIHEETRGWSRSFSDIQFDSKLDNARTNELNRLRKEAEEGCMALLRELLGEERYKQIPGARSTPARGAEPRQQSDRQQEAQRRRDELYKRFDTDGNGRLDSDERQRMRDALMRDQREGRGNP